MSRTQVSVDVRTCKRSGDAVRPRGVSPAEPARARRDEMRSCEPTRQPWMAWVGAIDGDPNGSSAVDEVVHGRDP